MEAAGLVLGAVPIAIAVLQCYRTGRTLTDRVRNRKRHVDRLIRALQGHDAVLELYLIWLLKAADAYDVHHTPKDIPSLLTTSEVVDRAKELLGEKGFAAFQNAVSDCQDTIQTVATSIEGFMPKVVKKNGARLVSIAERSVDDVEYEFRKGIKLALGKEDVDNQIEKLDMATKTIDRLHSTSTAIHQIDAGTSSKTSRKLARYLLSVRRCADRVHENIRRGWTPGCHASHDARLVLEDRVEAAKTSRYPSQGRKQSVSFKLIFSSGSPDQLWEESEIEVSEEPPDQQLRGCQPSGSLNSRITTRSQAPTVTFAITSPPRDSFAQVQDICVSLGKARVEQKHLRLYLLPEGGLHHDTASMAANAAITPKASQTTTLAALLSASSTTTDRSKKLPLRARMFLALTLASTLLQLSATPWTGGYWSKETIHFLTPPTAVVDSCQHIDLTKPLILQCFANNSAPVGAQPQPSSTPEQMITELGIMLLEIGNELPLETYATTTVAPPLNIHNDAARIRLARKWLLDSEEFFTPAYFDVTERCLRCPFEGILTDENWGPGSLSHSLVEGVVEPLQDLCRPKRF